MRCELKKLFDYFCRVFPGAPILRDAANENDSPSRIVLFKRSSNECIGNLFGNPLVVRTCRKDSCVCVES